ncbi:MAG: inorganic diphosphatase [Caulobacteraceae bacterium]|nr:inorganic diphosphatase [Caulobacteraceae bacterium]
MGDLTRLSHKLDEKTGVCRAIIETPKGRRSKFDYDPHTGLFKLKAVLPDGMSFPLDYGFIPSTLADDGDPADVMVLMDEPACVGALIDVRLIGVVEAEETEHGRSERNDRLLAVASFSHIYADVRAPEDLPRTFLAHLGDFWMNKERLEGKEFKVLRLGDASDAVRLVKKSSKAAKAQA